MSLLSKKNIPQNAIFYTLKRLLFLLLALPLLFFVGCKEQVNYFDYVSELRSNIFLAKTEEYSLKIFAVRKETPYVADGIPQSGSSRIEVYFLPPEGDRITNITLRIGKETVGGEMSYDNVKCEYYYSRTMDVSALSFIDCTIEYGEKKIELRANSVVTEHTLSPEIALQKLQETQPELFASLTDEYGFAGEIYLRLLFEDSPYYYIGVIDRDGKVTAFLMNAESGKILAKREN